MAKILFVPASGREIEQLSLVRNELPDRDIFAIALNETLGASLQRTGFSYHNLAHYKASNMLDIIQKEMPDLLIAYDEGGAESGFIVAAKYVGVPVLMMDDGLTGGASAYKISKKVLLWKIFRWFKSEGKFRSYWPLLVTLKATNSPWRFLKNAIKASLRFFRHSFNFIDGVNVAVVSSHARKMYINMGAEPERVFVTGQPRFDQIWQKKFDREYAFKELGLSQDKGIVVLATQPLLGSFWTEKDRENFVTTIVNAMDQFPEKQLVIKLHPSEKMEEYRQILTKMGHDGVIICQDIDLYQLLHASDLLMTIHSTVALEAMLLDKPVITVNLSGRPDLFPFAESGAAIGVYDEKSLVPAIRKALYDAKVGSEMKRKRTQFVQEHAYKQDGQASKRMAELIIQLAEEAKPKAGMSNSVSGKKPVRVVSERDS